MYLRSLGKELYNNGSTVIQSNEEAFKQFNEGFSPITDEDEATGNIYVLSSLSEKTEIQSIKDLYKIGFSTTSVEERIANAENETTFLMAPVKIVSSYKTYNLNPQKFEDLIHQVFSIRRLNIKVADKEGNLKQPKEWYIVPIRVIEQAIELIINKKIQNYKFDHLQNKIVKT
jgi:T5orf172 domain.